MVKQLSYTKYENEILPEYRQKLNKAESSEDVRKFFFQTVRGLCERIFEKDLGIRYEDIVLNEDDDPPYGISERLLALNDFKTVWNDSDLPHMMARLTKTAINRQKRLERHPEKTDSKIRK